MTYQEQTLLMIKGHITTLPPEQQSIVSECVATIRAYWQRILMVKR